jgi:hypothetical protein
MTIKFALTRKRLESIVCMIWLIETIYLLFIGIVKEELIIVQVIIKKIINLLRYYNKSS